MSLAKVVVVTVCVFIITAGVPDWLKFAWVKWVWSGLMPAALYVKGLYEEKPMHGNDRPPENVNIVGQEAPVDVHQVK